MNFYTQQHKQYCGIDLHARAMYICILDQAGTILVHKNLPTTRMAFSSNASNAAFRSSSVYAESRAKCSSMENGVSV